jgi:hypothetical protein
MSNTNFILLEPSRKKVRDGDLFAMKMADGEYLFGCIVDAEPQVSPMVGSMLAYLYSNRENSSDIDDSLLCPSNLLIPPFFINKRPWLDGYFKTIRRRTLSTDDLLPAHCFHDPAKKIHCDRSGNKVEHSDPCGDWLLRGYLKLDDIISDALGIPRATGK